MHPYLLGIDNGLTGIKAVLFDLQGNEIASAGSPTPVKNRGDGIVEMNPEELWEATAAVIQKVILTAGLERTKIAAVGNSAHGNGIYLVGPSGEPLIPAILPMDLRSKEIVLQWERDQRNEAIFEYILQKTWPGQPAAILRWLKENCREIYPQIGRVLFCKDWLKFKLTGNFCTDYSDASAAGLLDNERKMYSPELFSLYGIPEMADKLPPVMKSWEICGSVCRDAAEKTGLMEGTPVAAGMFDVNACCLGTGVFAPGRFSVIAGTWGINSGLSKERVKNKNIVQCTVFADGAQYLCIDSGATSTVNLEWFLKNTAFTEGSLDHAGLDEIAGQFTPRPGSPLFLPYIYPSIHRPDVQAAFFGLKAEHTWKELLRAVYEGVALGHAAQLERLKACGLRGDSVIFTGGASKSAVWCAVFADALGMTLETRKTKQSGALGAAMAAGIAAGVFPDMPAAVRHMVTGDAIYEPNPENMRIYKQKAKRMEKIIEILSQKDKGE